LHANKDGLVKAVFLLGVVNDFSDGAINKANEWDFADTFFYGLPYAGAYPVGGQVAQKDKDGNEDKDSQAGDIQRDNGVQPLQEDSEHIDSYDGGKEKEDPSQKVREEP
jgi:hypothetical protein